MVPPRPARLAEALDEVEIVLRRRKYVQTNGDPKCQAYYDPMAQPNRIVVAIRHPKIRSADDLVLAIIHELVHHAGFGETAAYGMEKAYYTSRTLREAILRRLG